MLNQVVLLPPIVEQILVKRCQFGRCLWSDNNLFPVGRRIVLYFGLVELAKEITVERVGNRCGQSLQVLDDGSFEIRLETLSQALLVAAGGKAAADKW